MNFPQFLDAAHISTLNCDEKARDRPRQLAIKFLASNVDFSSLSPDILGFKEAGASGSQRQLPPKKWLVYPNYLV